jgi:hypothetical protein
MNGSTANVTQKELSLARQPAPAKTPPKAPAKNGTFSVNMTPFTTGVSGTIAFDPDPKNCPLCKLIRLVQIVRVFEKPGVEYAFTGGEAPREKVKTAANKKKGVKANYFVDHQAAGCSKGNKCSLYYREHWPNASELAGRVQRRHDGGEGVAVGQPYWRRRRCVRVRNMCALRRYGHVFALSWTGDSRRFGWEGDAVGDL